jgi:ribosome-associated protein
VKAIEASLDADKAEDIVRIDLAGKSSMADFMVVATGTNARQLSAMADHLVEKLKATGRAHVPVEGRRQGDWVLVDAGDVIVHLFRAEARAHYALEKMWQADFGEEAGGTAKPRRPSRTKTKAEPAATPAGDGGGDPAAG